MKTWVTPSSWTEIRPTKAPPTRRHVAQRLWLMTTPDIKKISVSDPACDGTVSATERRSSSDAFPKRPKCCFLKFSVIQSPKSALLIVYMERASVMLLRGGRARRAENKLLFPSVTQPFGLSSLSLSSARGSARVFTPKDSISLSKGQA